MEKLKLSEIAAACGGTYNRDCEICGVCIDTRKITKGCLFLCIEGARFDAHQFAAEALEKGAAAVMVHRPIDADGCVVQVENTAKALLALGGYYRSRFSIPVIGLTGSVGKTTTKEFTYLAVAAKYKTIKTPGNLNNEIGLPQVLFQIDSTTQAAVIEMGMNHFGEIARLTQATKPTLAIITNIGTSHIENLGSRTGILRAKLEITQGLPDGAPLLLNVDNDLLRTVKSERHRVLFFGIDSPCDYTASDISEENGRTHFTVSFAGGQQEITIPIVGRHNVYNALAAFAAAQQLGVDSKAAAAALADYVPEGMRQRSVAVGGRTVIEDCYNASPDSMQAAIRTLSDTKAQRKIAVLADMLELGDYAETAHREIGRAVAESQIDLLYTYGTFGGVLAQAAQDAGMQAVCAFSDKAALAAALAAEAKDGDAILFKASRGMRLEDVIHMVYDRWGK